MPTWEQNRDFMIRQEAAGKATPEQLAWLEKHASGATEGGEGMLSQAAREYDPSRFQETCTGTTCLTMA